MSTNSYKKLWHTKVADELPEFREILSWGLFKDWDRDRMPDAAAAGELHLGLDLLYAEVEAPMAKKYVTRCIEVADRAFAEDKFHKSKWCRPGFPKNRGLTERVRQYARALLGKKLDTDALLSGAEDIITYFKTWDDTVDSQMHAYWLAAVRMTLIAGQPPRAAELIGEASCLKWHQKEADLLDDIAQAAVVAQPIKDKKLLARLDKLFDKVRSPKWRGSARIFGEPDEQRLELGAIRYRYFVSKDGKIDWNAVIESIRR